MRPIAIFAFVWQLDPSLPAVRYYTILGGPSDRSTVSGETLRQLGIAEPEAA